MIEEVVAAQPNSGYILDSLGWVQFVAELMAGDPIVNDNLGDASGQWPTQQRLPSGRSKRTQSESSASWKSGSEGGAPIRVTNTDG